MTTGDGSPIKSHDHVLVQLDTGDIVEASVVSIRREERRTGRVSKRKRSWSRWAGKPEHVVDIARTVAAEIQRKTGEAPAITIGVQFKQDEDEEYYFDLDSFDNDLGAAEQGSRSISLGHITQIGMTLGPTVSGQMTANLLFSGQAPAVRMEIEGTDKVDVIGIRDHVATVIAPGRRRPPAPNMLAYYIIGGFLGFLYFTALGQIDFGFLPTGFFGDFLGFLIFLAGWLAAVYGSISLLNVLLPPFALARPGQKSTIEIWRPRVARAVTALVGAIVPFLLGRLFPAE